MRRALEPALQSGDTGQRIPFWQLSIDHNMDVHKDFHLQVKHRLCLGQLGINARLQENSQSEHTFYYSHIIINNIRQLQGKGWG